MFILLLVFLHNLLSLYYFSYFYMAYYVCITFCILYNILCLYHLWYFYIIYYFYITSGIFTQYTIFASPLVFLPSNRIHHDFIQFAIFASQLCTSNSWNIQTNTLTIIVTISSAIQINLLRRCLFKRKNIRRLKLNIATAIHVDVKEKLWYMIQWSTC